MNYMKTESIVAIQLVAGVMGGAVADNSHDVDGALFDGAFEDELIEFRAELSFPPGERSVREIRDRGDSDRFSETEDMSGSESDASEDTGQPDPVESSLKQYCADESDDIDQACQSIANLVDCVVVAPNSASLDGADVTAPYCLEETPEPVEDEEVLEAAVEEPEDAEPDIDLIIEQIPGEVAEEFATLPIDGGSVAFEEELQGFGFINRHTNVFADVEDQTFERDMLGIDVEIRAVPVDYHFDYGDGTVRSAADPGSSAAGSASALTDVETPTSHVYQETGLYDVGLTATFTGEYRIAGGAWTPIADSTTVEASPGQADIWRTQARHVSGQCEDPGQWGCNGPFTIDGDDRPPDVFADQYDDAGNWRGP